MHLNELSLMGNEEAAGGGAARAGPTINTATITQVLRAPEAADRIVIFSLRSKLPADITKPADNTKP
jgi:hypothetical protein